MNPDGDSSFASTAAAAGAQAFWNDPEYQRVAPLRRSGSESQVVLIDGVPAE